MWRVTTGFPRHAAAVCQQIAERHSGERGYDAQSQDEARGFTERRAKSAAYFQQWNQQDHADRQMHGQRVEAS